MGVKSQVSVEYLVIISVAFLILTPLIVYSYQLFIGYKDETKIALAKDLVKKVGEGADWVYSQGYPARMCLKVTVPEGVTEASLLNKTVLLKIKTVAGETDIYHNTNAPLNGSLPVKAGVYKICLIAFPEYVNVSESV